MFGQIIACFDGSSSAEKILPVARCMTASTGGRLTLLRIVQDAAELAAEEQYLRECGRQYNAELRFRVSTNPADAIVAELDRVPGGIAALTTHGRSAWMEAVRPLREKSGGDFIPELKEILTLSRVRDDSYVMKQDIRRVASYYAQQWAGLAPLPGDPPPR